MKNAIPIRGPQGPREIQAVRVVVLRNVFLHLRRLFRALSDWEIAGNDRWKDALATSLKESC